MQKFLGALALIIAGAVLWRATGRLSPDAIGMALGVLVGVLAGLPVALLVLAAQRRPPPPRAEHRPDAYRHDPPIIVLTGDNHHVPNQNRPQSQRSALLPGACRPHRSGRTLPDPDDGEDWT